MTSKYLHKKRQMEGIFSNVRTSLKEAKVLACSTNNNAFTNSNHLLARQLIVPSSESCLKKKVMAIQAPIMTE